MEELNMTEHQLFLMCIFAIVFCMSCLFFFLFYFLFCHVSKPYTCMRDSVSGKLLVRILVWVCTLKNLL